MMKYPFLFCFVYCSLVSFAQEGSWDDTLSKGWPPAFDKVFVKSSFDNSVQPCIAYKARSAKPRPLIVSLHTWSGDYLQQDSLSYRAAENDWNYIHPDFRGPNNRPIAMGSPAVVQDIDDAINYAIQTMNVDTAEVHIIGVSGGGFATMLCYMRLRYPAKSFSSWVGISDLKAWYEECSGRKLNYAADILKSTSGTEELDTTEALKRSPLHMDVPFRRGKLYLYTGIHDGYLGSVPITQTINFYNHIVSKKYPASKELPVSDREILDMVVKRRRNNTTGPWLIGTRRIFYFSDAKDVSLCIFDGKHERLEGVAASLLPVYKQQPNKQVHILTLGDSNGSLGYGWPRQLKQEIPYASIVNSSRSGKTIGFVNNGDSSLNQLITLNGDLEKADSLSHGQAFDFIVISLGTNDAKAVFDKRQDEVAVNLEKLITQIKSKEYASLRPARIVIISPPPYGKQAMLQEKYAWGLARVKKMNRTFKAIAQKQHCLFVDAFTPLLPVIDELAKDGLHMNARGQRIIAQLVIEKISAETAE